jgi:uncharacterized integral membrane protein
MRKFKTIVIALVLVLVLIIVLQNTQSVETKLLFARVTMPRALLLMLTFLFGFVAGLLAALSFGRKAGREHSD